MNFLTWQHACNAVDIWHFGISNLMISSKHKAAIWILVEVNFTQYTTIYLFNQRYSTWKHKVVQKQTENRQFHSRRNFSPLPRHIGWRKYFACRACTDSKIFKNWQSFLKNTNNHFKYKCFLLTSSVSVYISGCCRLFLQHTHIGRKRILTCCEAFGKV